MIILESILNFWRYLRNNFRRFWIFSRTKNCPEKAMKFNFKGLRKINIKHKENTGIENKEIPNKIKSNKDLLNKHICNEKEIQMYPNGFQYSERQFLHEKILSISEREGISYSKALDKLFCNNELL